MIRALIIFSLLLAMLPAKAGQVLPKITKDMAYEDAKKVLIADGWKPVHNLKISGSSLYAQELYEQGMLEVVDCISMELDGCRFYYTKKNQTLEIRTITRQLKVEKMHIINKKNYK